MFVVFFDSTPRGPSSPRAGPRSKFPSLPSSCLLLTGDIVRYIYPRKRERRAVHMAARPERVKEGYTCAPVLCCSLNTTRLYVYVMLLTLALTRKHNS